jgi:hypothetical protein
LVDLENTNQAIKNHFKGNENRYLLVNGGLDTFGQYKTEDELLRDVIPTSQQAMRGDGRYQYEVYANITNPYEIDADGEVSVSVCPTYRDRQDEPETFVANGIRYYKADTPQTDCESCEHKHEMGLPCYHCPIAVDCGWGKPE